MEIAEAGSFFNQHNSQNPRLILDEAVRWPKLDQKIVPSRPNPSSFNEIGWTMGRLAQINPNIPVIGHSCPSWCQLLAQFRYLLTAGTLPVPAPYLGKQLLDVTPYLQPDRSRMIHNSARRLEQPPW